MDGLILCVNTGSSSLKWATFDAAGTRVLDGEAKGASAEPVLKLLEAGALPDAVVHRVVHGGEKHVEPERVTPALLASLESIVPLAPLHLPPAIAAMRQIAARLPDLPQLACFDTAFHTTLPDSSRTLPLPKRARDLGARRYGFHGLSYEHVVHELGLPGRAVLAHLGNGASLCAVRAGKSVETTMGLTPTGGIPMGTRSGDLDPGVALFLLRGGLSVDDFGKMVEREAGLLGLSETTSDMKALLAAQASDDRARLAVEVFCRRVRMAVGSLAAALEGLDTLVFTGGIGEHSAELRERICGGLGWLGVRIDGQSNEAVRFVRGGRGRFEISAAGSAVAVHVVRADEDGVMARHARVVIGGSVRP